MKKYIVLLFIPFISFGQNYKPDAINLDSLKRIINDRSVKYDTIEAVVTYINKYKQLQDDTCTIFLEAKKSYVFYDFGQFKECEVKFSRIGHYVVYPNWEILQIMRYRKKETLYKGRIIKFKRLKTK